VSAPDRLDFYDGELRAHHEHLRAATLDGHIQELVYRPILH